MKKEMLINVLQPEECRIAIVEDGVLEELYVERTSHESYTGNIYKGKIVNLEPAIQAAFVNFSVGRNGFLHVSDVEPQYFHRHGAADDEPEARPRGREREPQRDRDRGKKPPPRRDRGRGREERRPGFPAEPGDAPPPYPSPPRIEERPRERDRDREPPRDRDREPPRDRDREPPRDRDRGANAPTSRSEGRRDRSESPASVRRGARRAAGGRPGTAAPAGGAPARARSRRVMRKTSSPGRPNRRSPPPCPRRPNATGIRRSAGVVNPSRDGHRSASVSGNCGMTSRKSR